MARLRRTHTGALTLLALAGCDTVFQLEKVSPVERITGSYLDTDIEADGSVTTYPPPRGVIELRLAVPDGTSTTVEMDDQGRFAFDYPHDLRYRLILNGYETYPLEFVSSSSTLLLGSTSFGRRERTPVTKSTPLQYTTNAALTGYVRFASTGHRAFIEATGVTPATTEWLDARPADEIGSSIGLLDAAEGDQLYYLHFQPASVYFRITDVIATQPTMVDGQPVVVGSTVNPAPVTPVPLDRCVHIVAPLGTEVARLAALDGPTTVQSSEWGIASVANRDIGAGGRLRLVLDATNATTNTDTDVVYATPFVGEQAVATMIASSSRPLIAPGSTIGTDLPLSTTVMIAVDPTPNVTTCPDNKVDLGALRTPILDRMNVGGNELVADNQAVTLDRTALVRALVTFDSVPPYDTVEFKLFEVADAANRTELRPLRAITTIDAFVDLDPVLFLRNRRYIFSVTTKRQLFDALHGNFRDQTLPVVAASRFSPMFLIAN